MSATEPGVEGRSGRHGTLMVRSGGRLGKVVGSNGSASTRG